MTEDIKISRDGSLLVYKKGYTPAFVAETIRNRNLRGMRIFAHLREDRLQTVDFLREYDFLEALDITSLDDFDFACLSALPQLKELSIDVRGKNTIDLHNLTNLQSLSITWRKAITGIDRCQKLEEICLVEFKQADLSLIKTLKNLKEVLIKTASIKNLSGLEHLGSLRLLSLGNCRSLRSIVAINGLSNLKRLDIDACSNIADYESLTNLPNLETLRIVDCRGLKSIKFVKQLPALTRLTLSGNTNVLDGDMTPTVGIKEVLSANRKHYNIKIPRCGPVVNMKDILAKLRSSDTSRSSSGQ